jgi:hypothetical protein
MAHLRQSEPDSGLGVQVKSFEVFEGFLFRSTAAKFYLRESVCKVVLQKSIPAQNHQLTLYVSNNEG